MSNSPTSSSSAVGTEVKTGDFFSFAPSSSSASQLAVPSAGGGAGGASGRSALASPASSSSASSSVSVSLSSSSPTPTPAGRALRRDDAFGFALPEFDVGNFGGERTCANVSILRNTKDTTRWRELLTKGSCVDAQDGDQMWYEAVINDASKKNITVRFLGWSKKWNALLPRDSLRIAPRNSKVPNWRQTLTPGKCVEVSTSDSCTWCTAVVSIVEPTRFQVIRAPACTTEWHDIDSPLIAEPYTHCGYKIEADARERRRMLAARRNLFVMELQICRKVQGMASRIRVAQNIGEHLLGLTMTPTPGNCNNVDRDSGVKKNRGDGGDGESNESGTGDRDSSREVSKMSDTASKAAATSSATSGGADAVKMNNVSNTLSFDSTVVLKNDPPFSDITFIVDGERVQAHRAIIISRSAYFRRMFLGGMREASECEKAGAEITILDTRAATFRTVIKFIYTGMCNVHHDNALELLHAAHLFCLDGLARGIESFLYRAVSVDTAIEILVAAHTYSLVDLEEHCVEFIIDHYEMFVFGKGFSKLATHPQILISIMERIKRPKKRRSLRSASGDAHNIAQSGGNRGGVAEANESPRRWSSSDNIGEGGRGATKTSGSTKSSDVVDGIEAEDFNHNNMTSTTWSYQEESEDGSESSMSGRSSPNS